MLFGVRFRWVLSGALTFLLGIFLFLALVVAGCRVISEEITPEDLRPGEVMVAGTRPDSGEIPLTGSLSLLLAGEAVADSLAAVDRLAQAPARIEPSIGGYWKWQDPQTLVFVPEEAFQPNTAYVVTLDKGFFRNQGLTLRGERDFQFTAAPFRLESFRLSRDRLPGVERRYLVRGFCRFSYPVDPRDLARYLDCRLDQRGAVDFALGSTAVSRNIELQIGPIEAGSRDEMLRVIIDGDLPAQVGGRALGEEIQRQLQIPAIERLEIRQANMRSQGEQAVVVIDFSEPVSIGELERKLTIEPEVADLRLTGDYREVRLEADWVFGQTYTLRLDASLASDSGLLLERDWQGTVYIDELDPWLEIVGNGNYLSLRGERRIAVKSLGLDKLRIEVDRVFANNLVPFLQVRDLGESEDQGNTWRSSNWQLRNQGETLFSEVVPVTAAGPNTAVLTPVDLGAVLDSGAQGIFRLTVDQEQGWGLRRSKWIVATDLGLVVKQAGDDLLVAVTSVSRLAPVGGATVQVYSRNNQLLATGKTDAQGWVVLSDLPEEGSGSDPFVVTAALGRDLSFLAFAETGIRMGDLDIDGVDLPATGYRAFVYGDRDIYRPGETAHLTWLLRDTQLRPAGGFPLTLEVWSPTGLVFSRSRVDCDAAGAGELSLELPAWAQTGRYDVRLTLDDETEVGRRTLRVEDFMPDRMKVTAQLEVADRPVALAVAGDSLVLAARAMTLFGPPAADRQAKATLWYARTDVHLDDWPDFVFGDPDADLVPPRRDLGQVVTDADGDIDWDVPLPDLPDYHGWLRLNAAVEVAEPGGGRAVTGHCAVDFAPTTHLLGLHNLSADQSDYVEPGQDLRFAAVLVDNQGHAVSAAGAEVRVLRRHWRTVLRRDPGSRYRYVSEYDEEEVLTQVLDLSAEPTEFVINVPRNGSYRLVVATADGRARGALPFYVYGSGYTPWALSEPELVNLKLDRDAYAEGATVTASIEAPFAGLMLLTVERERIYHRQWVRLDSNTGTVRIEVPQGIAPNAYITATLLRPLDDLDPHAPARAFGAVPLFIDRGPSTLPVEVRAPESMRPRSSLAVQVRLPDLPRDVPARITVAAVDEGILQLTDAATPSPLDFFHMRRSLVVGTYDTWAWLLPEYERVRQTSSPGGGLAENKMVMAGLADRLNPLSVPRVKPVALWSGLLDGTRTWQTIDFDVPEFNGTLRLMVVASAGTRFGSATEQVQVADPFVLTPSLPRFLAPGDAFRVPVAVYNGVSEPGVASPVRVELELSGPLALAESSARVVTLDVAGGQEEVVWFDLRATDAVGAASVTFTASGGTETVTRTIELPVRAPWPLEVTAQGGTVTEATPASVMAADRWYPGTGRTVVSVAANPIAGFGEALPYLLRYPYGCAEQRTSRAFPLLYFGNLAAQIAPESFTDGDADYYVNSGLDYLTALHRPGQGFALWPGPRARTTNPWASVYVTHFLVSARKAGYVVSEAVLDDALDHVAELARTSERGWSDGWLARYRLGTRCYAAYVLAVADRPEKGAMEELARNHWRDLPSSARTHLAGAYALIGNRARFDELLPAGEATEADRRSLGYTWSSRARDDAMALEVLATVDPEHPQVAGLIQRLSRRARNGRWHNTHENGWALLALGKLAGTGRIAPAEGEILVGGQVAATFDAEGASVSGTDWGDREIVVRATTPGTAWYTVRSQGIPRSGGESDIDAGLSLVRTYLDADGAPLDPRTLTQGQTVVCRLSLLSQRGRVSDVVVTDLVPAGLEIENPRLARTGGFDWLDEDRGNRMRLPQEHLEIRDDRLLLFTRADTREGVFYYTLRAVTAGRFVAPPAKAEAMYDPEVRSVGPIGEVNVVAP